MPDTEKPFCPDCRACEAWHCSDPEHCGSGLWDAMQLSYDQQAQAPGDQHG